MQQRCAISRYGTTLLSAFLAGVMIAIGGTVYLKTSDPVIGAGLFSVGLYTVVAFGLHLFTGKVGYAFDMEHPISTLILSWIGNLVGTVVTATLLLQTGMSDVGPLVTGKLAQSHLSTLIMSFFCGVLMFVAVDCYKQLSGSALRVVMVLLPVAVFILCGFEHCVANMFYFTLAGVWSWAALVKLLIMTVGNAIGALAFSLIYYHVIRGK